MGMEVSGKVFVVTGAAGGIGSQLVYALLARGATVAAVDLSQKALDGLTNEYGGKLSTHALDITDRNAVFALPDEVTNAHGQVDGLINCAGIIQPFVKVSELEFDAIERVMNVNFYGTLYMTKAFLPRLLARPEAYLVNVSSMGGFLPVPGQAVYGASKAAVKLLTEALYAELQGTSVHVSVVFPGATATDISKNSGVSMPGQAETAAKQSIPMLSPDKVAALIVKGMERGKPQIFTGADSKLMNKLYRLNPVYATRFIARRMKSLLG